MRVGEKQSSRESVALVGIDLGELSCERFAVRFGVIPYAQWRVMLIGATGASGKRGQIGRRLHMLSNDDKGLSALYVFDCFILDELVFFRAIIIAAEKTTAMLIGLSKLRRSDLATIQELDKPSAAILQVYDYIWKSPIIEVSEHRAHIGYVI